MKWSIKICSVSGVGVFIHPTFFLLLAWVAHSSWRQQANWGYVIESILFVIAVFACVVLHEGGHAVAAARYGISTRDITVLPIGGLARLERMPERPLEEIVVSLAGPAVNVVIGLVLWRIWRLTAGTPDPEADPVRLLENSFILRLAIVNIVLVVFNLVPAFPMDGGRVARALLATQLPYVNATLYAVHLGRFIAVLFGTLGLMYNPILLLIAMFIWIGGGAEAQGVILREQARKRGAAHPPHLPPGRDDTSSTEL